jgi:hypothetical protein
MTSAIVTRMRAVRRFSWFVDNVGDRDRPGDDLWGDKPRY